MNKVKVVFMGTSDFAVPVLRTIYDKYDLLGVVTQPDRKSGRGQRLTPTAVKAAALDFDKQIPIMQPQDINDPVAIGKIADLSLDVLVVVAYGQLLKQQLLSLAPLGAVNVHASLLPHLRGGAPIHWSIILGHQVTGVTTMMMRKGLDSGPILLQSKTPISPNETVGDLHDRLAQMGAHLLVDTLDNWEDIVPMKQDHKSASYAPNLSKADRIINWDEPVSKIHDLVRGLNPWPVAYTTFNGNLLHIYKAEIEDEQVCGVPGTVMQVNQDSFTIACHSGLLKVLTVRPQSRKVMSAGDFCRGYRLAIGDTLGREG